MSTRIDRISEEVMKALAEAMRSVKDPRVQEAMVSVVHCDVTNDLRYAKCYISVLGSEQQTKDCDEGPEVCGRLAAPRGWHRYSAVCCRSWYLSWISPSPTVHTSPRCWHELKNEGKLGEEDAE